MSSGGDGKNTKENGFKVCLDTSIFINARSEWEKGSEKSRSLLRSIRDGEALGVISTITIAELLNGAYRKGVEEANRLKADFRAFESSGSLIMDLNFPLADVVGELCARYNTRIRPDVIIVASALMARADVVATRDIDHFSRYKNEVWIAEPEEVLLKLQNHKGIRSP